MFTKSAELYDKIYSQFKNYEEEVVKVKSFIDNLDISVGTILDVGCGTGEHARILHEKYGYSIDGFDIDEQMAGLAQKKNPHGNFICADMCSFDIGKKYDAVICLFSSIGYAKTIDKVTAALRNFRDHLNPGGIILVEPWMLPGQLEHGRVTQQHVDEKEMKIARMSHAVVDGNLSTIHFEYLVGTAEGIIHEKETHTLGLFTLDEMKNAFNNAGLNVEFDPEGLSEKGLYIAKP